MACGNISRGFSNFLVVHEIGHVFDNQADQGGNQSINEYANGASLRDQTNAWVLGAYAAGVRCNQGVVLAAGWARGERGWGSGPGSIYISGTDERCQNPTTPNFTDFQQNAPPYQVAPGLTPEQVARQETAADMFLNWVYRIQARGGFLNTSWKPNETDPNTGQYCNRPIGCLDIRNPGNARFEWMHLYMTSTLTRLMP